MPLRAQAAAPSFPGSRGLSTNKKKRGRRASSRECEERHALRLGAPRVAPPAARTMESGFEDLAAPAALDDAFREAEVNGGSAADATAAPAAVATAADAPDAVATAAAAASAGAPSDGLDYAAIVHYGAHGVGVPGKIVRVHELVDGGDARQATALPLPIGSAHATAEPVYAAAEADAVLPADASSTAIVALTKPPKPPRARRCARARAEHGHRARRAAAQLHRRGLRGPGPLDGVGYEAEVPVPLLALPALLAADPAVEAAARPGPGRRRLDGRAEAAPRGRAPQGCHWDDSAGAWRDQYGAIVMPKKAPAAPQLSYNGSGAAAAAAPPIADAAVATEADAAWAYATPAIATAVAAEAAAAVAASAAAMQAQQHQFVDGAAPTSRSTPPPPPQSRTRWPPPPRARDAGGRPRQPRVRLRFFRHRRRARWPQVSGLRLYIKLSSYVGSARHAFAWLGAASPVLRLAQGWARGREAETRFGGSRSTRRRARGVVAAERGHQQRPARRGERAHRRLPRGAPARLAEAGVEADEGVGHVRGGRRIPKQRLAQCRLVEELRLDGGRRRRRRRCDDVSVAHDDAWDARADHAQLHVRTDERGELLPHRRRKRRLGARAHDANFNTRSGEAQSLPAVRQRQREGERAGQQRDCGVLRVRSRLRIQRMQPARAEQPLTPRAARGERRRRAGAGGGDQRPSQRGEPAALAARRPSAFARSAPRVEAWCAV